MHEKPHSHPMTHRDHAAPHEDCSECLDAIGRVFEQDFYPKSIAQQLPQEVQA